MERPTSLDSQPWVSCSRTGDGWFTAFDFTNHIIRVTFDKSVTRSFSRFRVLLVAPKEPETWYLPVLAAGEVTIIREDSRSPEPSTPLPEVILLLSLQAPESDHTRATLQVHGPSSMVKGREAFTLYDSGFEETPNLLALRIPLKLRVPTMYGQNITYYYIHVAACSRGDSPFPPTLDLAIIRQIFKFCMSQVDLEAQGKVILNLSLISKHWYSVSAEIMNYYFSNLISEKEHLYTPTLPRIVGMLRQTPSRGFGVEKLPPPYFPVNHPRVDGGRARNVWLSNISSLHHHLPDLTTIHTMSPLMVRACAELSRLRKVVSLRVNAPNESGYAYWGDEEYNYCYGKKEDLVGVVLRVINGWERLEEMELVGNELRPGRGFHEIPDKGSQYCLAKLSLSEMFVGPNRISYIISGRNSRLTQISFDKLGGLSRLDYRMVFESVASTIKNLTIRRCEVEPDTEQDVNAEAPLDSVIARMPKVLTITIQSELASNLSIAWKVRSDTDSGVNAKITVLEYKLDDLDTTTDRVGLGIKESLQQTGWDSVSLYFGRVGTGKLDKGVKLIKRKRIKVGQHVARKRGIQFLTP